jgi:hypothetical protein
MKDPCPYCLRPLSPEVIAIKKARKRQIGLNTLRLCKERGIKLGRKKSIARDDQAIKEMVNRGWTTRQIAAALGISQPSVIRGLRAKEK